MNLFLQEDGPYLDFTTKDGKITSINLKVLAEETGNETLFQWCEERLGRPLRRRLQVVAKTEPG
jgi:hypothetical protein